jgi:uncharacterized protein (TIGR02266 family)
MDTDRIWAIVFGSADGSRLTRLAEFIATLPRLCQGELRSCDVGHSAPGRVLLAIARFGMDEPSGDVRQRLEFWVHHENGRAVELPRERPDERPHEALLKLCERAVRGVQPSNLGAAVADLIGEGAPVEIVARRHLAIMFDLAVDGSGLAFDGGVHKLFVPTPLPLPLGDELAIQVVTEDGVRTCEARVEAWREAGTANAGSSAGLIVDLVTPSSDLLATLATRLRRTLRRSPRYDVHLPVRVESPDAGALVRVEYRSRSHFAREYVENLSQGGAFVRTERPLAIGSRLQLEVVLPSGEALGMPGTVAHTRDGGMGVRFDLNKRREATLSAAIADLARRQRRALVVDDNTFARRLLKDALAERGFSVSEASDGASALRMLVDQLFAVDLVVADVVMAGMTGDDLVSEIRFYAGPRPAVVLASGRMDDEMRERLATCGADRLVDKGIGPEQVAKEADEAVESVMR